MGNACFFVISKKEAVMVDVPRVRMSGPLVSYERGFAGELLKQGYAPTTVLSKLRVMAHVSRWLTGEGLDAGGLTSDAVERFLAARRAAGYRMYLSSRGLASLLGYLRGLGAVPPASPVVGVEPVGLLLERYRRYSKVERGLADATIGLYVGMVRPFLTERMSGDGLDLEHLTAGDLTAFVVGACCGERRASANALTSGLRSLLVFLHVEGLIREGLTAAVPSVARWRLSGLPRPLEAGHVRRLLGSCDRRTQVGMRDFAILTLLVRLGLRAKEVAALRLEDIDWQAGEIVVRGKGDRHERLPLPADVGEAVAEYLRRGRPSSAEGRSVVVRVRAPHRELSRTGVAGVVVAAGHRAGLGSIRPHRLRHTVATEMLRAGATLPEVGQVLRHSSLQSTAIYAKVDRDALRSLARPWIGGAV
jgi:integrase/recombinase XerD